jgi:hypothetical protein
MVTVERHVATRQDANMATCIQLLSERPQHLETGGGRYPVGFHTVKGVASRLARMTWASAVVTTVHLAVVATGSDHGRVAVGKITQIRAVLWLRHPRAAVLVNLVVSVALGVVVHVVPGHRIFFRSDR